MLDLYRLELHWDDIVELDDKCYLQGAYFSGPATKIAKQIEPADSIVMDLTPQYSRIITSHYFLELFWDNVEYKDDKIMLMDVRLVGDYINNVSDIGVEDYIVIDTQNHEENIHTFNLVYSSKVVNSEGEEHKNA